MVTLIDIQHAHDRIRPYIHRTSVLTNRSLNDLTGAELFFKCENFQRAGSFKIRGATNAVELLSQDEIDRGVATTSSGNHGAALSMAVTRRGGSVTVVMPQNTPIIKVENVKRNGGNIVWCEPNLSSREKTLGELGGRISKARNDAGLEAMAEEVDADSAAGSALGAAWRISIEIVVALVVCTAIGWALDDWFGTKPWLMLIFLFLGGAAGINNAVRTALRIDARATELLQKKSQPTSPCGPSEDGEGR